MSAGGNRKRLHDVVLSQLPTSNRNRQQPQEPEKIKLPVERIETPVEKKSLPGLLPFFSNGIHSFADFITELFSTLATNNLDIMPSKVKVELEAVDGTVITATANINDIINKNDIIDAVLASSGTYHTAADIVCVKILQIGLP